MSTTSKAATVRAHMAAGEWAEAIRVAASFSRLDRSSRRSSTRSELLESERMLHFYVGFQACRTYSLSYGGARPFNSQYL